ncbi:MAG: ribokinase [Fimbriimonadales bacterium]|nr:MAG: ribokinase [Fimbriimonadales bacterium]
MTRPRILVVGSANIDLVVPVPSIPAPGETVLGGTLQLIPGGKGANQAVAAARLGAEVRFIGRIGNDEFGRRILQNLQREGIDVRFVYCDHDAPSGVALIAVADQGQNSIVVAPGANMRLSVADVESASEAFEDADAVVVQLEIPIEAVETAARLARQHGARLILNPAPARQLPQTLYPLIDYIIPNETEGRQLTGATEVATIIETLRKRGCQDVILTLGERGVAYHFHEALQQAPAYSVSAVDTTAAGDAFVAGFAVALCEGRPMSEAVDFGQRVASITVSRWGAQSALPYRGELEDASP